jgi:hypothetical protein
MGMEAARLGGIDDPVTTSQESTAKIMEVIDGATREKTAGKFIDVMTGEVYLW